MQAQMFIHSYELMHMDRGRLTLSMQHLRILCKLLVFLQLLGEGSHDLAEVVEAITDPASPSEHQQQASSTCWRYCSC